MCQAGSCRQAGSAAVLIEIEELAKSVGGCPVETSGCLGLCDKAPGVAIVSDTGCEYHPSIISPEVSAVIVEKATGKRPDLEDPVLSARLSFSRMTRKSIEAQKEFKWNSAILALKSLAALADDDDAKEQATFDLAECLDKAGRFEDALEVLSLSSADSIKDLQLMMMRSNLMSKVGNHEAAMELVSCFKKHTIQVMEILVEQESSSPETEELLQRCSNDLLLAGKQLRMVKSVKFVAPENRPVANYYPWRLVGIEKASEASNIYSFTCFGISKHRPTEKRRISGEVWRTVNSTCSLWHTTLLAHAPADTEGPCPWVERDYTPISTFSDWVLGKCDLLIKAYPGGKATQWLKRQALGALVHLSEPKLTEGATVPQCLAKPRLLFVVGGTGVAVAVQGLGALADDCKPVGVVYSCRADDALALDALEALIAQRAGLLGGPSAPATSVQVLLTATTAEPAAEAADLAVRHPSIRFAAGRLTRQVLAAALASISGSAAASAPEGTTTSGSADRTGRPVTAARAEEVGIVVSGPAGMNSAVASMLDELGFPKDAVAILQA